MKKKRSVWPEIAAAFLIVSLVVNGILAVRYRKLSKETEQTTKQLAARVEELSSLLQECQDACEKETGQETERESEKKEESGESRKKEDKTDDLELMAEELAEKYVVSREDKGEKWSISIQKLSTEEKIEYHASEKMQSASVIKVFIMGAVYDRMCYPSSPERLIAAKESYDGELRDLLEKMITVSDNEAANQLITKLGEGDFEKGAEAVNQFCMENGYTATSVGRKFLESNPSGDNYTSAQDCRKILSDIYHGTCVEKEASEKMLEILKRQTVKTKISLGVPGEVKTANKTGEMPEGYGLGCIENDMAIVFAENGDYILTVLSNELGGRNEEARQVIQEISREVYQWFQEN